MTADFIPSRGPVASMLMIVERELSAQDLLALAAGPTENAHVPAIKRISHRHRRQAQLIAEGYTLAEVAALTDSTPQRLTQLQRDPSFVNLIAYFGDQRMIATMETGARVRALYEEIAEETAEEIRDRVTDPLKRAALPISELRQLSAFAADRTVAPPKVAQPLAQAPANITLNFGRELKPQGDEPKDITPAPPAISHEAKE